MKKIGFIVACLLVSMASSHATITLGINFGNVYNAGGGSLVGDGTLWALVVDDASDDGIFAGFNVNQSLTSSAQADTYFDANSTRLNVGGTLNGNTIAAMGAFNAVDYGNGNMYMTISLSDTYANQNFAFYWFPGATYTGSLTGGARYANASYTGTSGGGGSGDIIGSQVGGVNTTSADGGAGLVGMTLGNAGATMGTAGMATTGVGGSTPENYLYAVVIPEPSTALLGLLGGAFLLRRRRR